MRVKNRGLKKCAVSLAMIFILGVGICIPAHADSYDAERTGSISVRLNDIETKLSGVEFCCYQVAELSEENEVAWELLPEFEDAGIDINQLETAEDYRNAAEKLAELSEKSHGQAIKKVTNEEGTVVFRNLLQGIYLIDQTDEAQYGVVAPVLIAVPYADSDNGWEYDVAVEGKGEHFPATDTLEEPLKNTEEKESANILKQIQTGDNSRVGICCLVIGIAGLTIVTAAARRRKGKV